MNYEQTLEFLFSQLPAYHRVGKAAYKGDLVNSITLDNYFGKPHRKYHTIHIGGTNGKGSVSHMIASVLQEAGYKTGLYTSPHLKDYRERIKVNGKMIAEHDVITFASDNKIILGSLKPSFFEMSVAMAFDHFEKKNIDIAVIEVGLGGRLDSTNIITPMVSVITNIGHDHMDLLGNTLEKVATEKAGIIKRGVPVVIGETTDETRKVFVYYANNSGAEMYFAEENYTCVLDEMDSSLFERVYHVHEIKSDRQFTGTIPLGGEYQKANLRTLFQLFRSLEGRLDLNEKNLSDGIKDVVKNTGLQGRWQILGKNPLIICDTGHNLEGLEYVIKQILQIRAAKRHMVIGFVSDKDLDSVLPLFPADSVYYFTKASVPRARDEKRLMAEAGRYGLHGNCYETVKEAYAAALKNSLPEDLIFIGGSTFVVAEVI